MRFTRLRVYPYGVMQHGTYSYYTHGCRCARCRDAWRKHTNERRAAQRKRRYYNEEPASVVTVSQLGNELLAAAEKRTRKTRRDVVEHLIRLYASSVQFEDESAA